MGMSFATHKTKTPQRWDVLIFVTNCVRYAGPGIDLDHVGML